MTSIGLILRLLINLGKLNNDGAMKTINAILFLFISVVISFPVHAQENNKVETDREEVE